MIKIFTFIVNSKNKKILLLRNNPKEKIHGGDFWYTVTGAVEKEDKDLIDAVKREIKEETNLNTNKVLYLNWKFKYNWNNIDCEEYVHISFVEEVKIILNEEKIDYKWCTLDEYIKEILWYDDKNKLKEILSLAMNEKLYFKNEQVDEY